jgi:hypothetical protein
VRVLVRFENEQKGFSIEYTGPPLDVRTKEKGEVFMF